MALDAVDINTSQRSVLLMSAAALAAGLRSSSDTALAAGLHSSSNRIAPPGLKVRLNYSYVSFW